MIFYTYNPEFDEETLGWIRAENAKRSMRSLSPNSIIYLFESEELTVGYLWLEVEKNRVEMVEFHFNGSNAKKWALYDFATRIAKKQEQDYFVIRVQEEKELDEFISKWGGKAMERDGKDVIIKIPFLKDRVKHF
ncbi:hypothetical protein ABFG93_03670 [Pseudalkalibacillus hwajinpoensis]|uniref:hypothetical protein n=1 Tax=Guptibacillus hwajinpoensis TaxID=208199 RepID=UPI00325BD898